jgi:hypothetical protein
MGLAATALMTVMASATANAADAPWQSGDWRAAYTSPHFYYLPPYYAPYGFRYVGNPDFPGCYFARRSGPRGFYLVPVC